MGRNGGVRAGSVGHLAGHALRGVLVEHSGHGYVHGDVEGFMNICLPYITLEPVMDKLNTKFWYSNMQERAGMEYADAIESLISKAIVPVKAILGKSIISVNDFSGLQPGDIIRLDTKVNQELDVYVGDIKKFTALPGSTGEDYAVRITSVIREEQE